jgi:hypothetical protein
MAAAILPNGKQQFSDINGKPLVGGLVYMYVPSTLIFKDTWQDSGQLVLNTNPIILDSRGEALIYGDGNYRQILKDSLGNLIWDEPVSAPIPVTSGLWTPSFIASVSPGAWTYSTQVGTWVKSGNVVSLTYNLVASGNSGASGQLLMTGLPFASTSASSVTFSSSPSWGLMTLPAGYSQMVLILTPNRTFYECQCSGSNQATGAVTTFAANPFVIGSSTYLTDS